ncbi:lysostaphin resistance A-like protein [Blautia sp. HCP28S3_G10]|uniref:CPBP family intramembrane glutamic endopeptidase n=1 Tax=Blautia sp. HCP28S3_G10 TaxID=3438908 RepID=UPI003F8BE4B4
MKMNGGGSQVYYDNAVLLTGITGILAMLPCLYLYRKDHIARKAGALIPQKTAAGKLTAGEVTLIFVMGAAFSQFANMFVALLQSFIDYQEYQETMDQITGNKSLGFLIICMGVIAPIAEEVVFRWLIYLRLRDYMKMGAAAVISGLIFGIYHGNLVQAVYASILGMVFACFLELTGNLWTSVLLHMGANIWSLVSPYVVQWLMEEYVLSIFLMVLLFIVVMVLGTGYFIRKSESVYDRII